VFFLEKRNVHTPDERGPAALHTFGRGQSRSARRCTTPRGCSATGWPRAWYCPWILKTRSWRGQTAAERQIRESLLSDIGMLVAFVRLNESRARTPKIPTTPLKMLACSKYSSMSSSPSLLQLNRGAYVRDGQAGGQRHCTVKAVCGEGHGQSCLSVQVYNTVGPNHTDCIVYRKDASAGMAFSAMAKRSGLVPALYSCIQQPQRRLSWTPRP